MSELEEGERKQSTSDYSDKESKKKEKIENVS